MSMQVNMLALYASILSGQKQQSRAYADQILKHYHPSMIYGITGAPTTFINGRLLCDERSGIARSGEDYSRRARPTIEAMIPVLHGITEHPEDLECRLSRVVERFIAAQIDSIE